MQQLQHPHGHRSTGKQGLGTWRSAAGLLHSCASGAYPPSDRQCRKCTASTQVPSPRLVARTANRAASPSHASCTCQAKQLPNSTSHSSMGRSLLLMLVHAAKVPYLHACACPPPCTRPLALHACSSHEGMIPKVSMMLSGKVAA